MCLKASNPVLSFWVQYSCCSVCVYLVRYTHILRCWLISYVNDNAACIWTARVSDSHHPEMLLWGWGVGREKKPNYSRGWRGRYRRWETKTEVTSYEDAITRIHVSLTPPPINKWQSILLPAPSVGSWELIEKFNLFFSKLKKNNRNVLVTFKLASFLKIRVFGTGLFNPMKSVAYL